MSRHIDADVLIAWIKGSQQMTSKMKAIICYIKTMPTTDLVRCKECKYRPIKEDPSGEDYGFNLIEPTEGDERCPCLVSDGWYSWMPKDDFYCGFGEREGER